MRTIREVLRLKWACGLRNRAVARSCRISSSTVSDYVRRARLAGLSWPLPADVDDAVLEAALFPPPVRPTAEAIPVPDWSAVHRELQGKAVTRQLVWQEYRAEHPTGYGYSQFCKRYHEWRARLHPTMRLTHQAGEAMVDYTGVTVPVMDPETGEVRQAEVFVHAMAASNYIYAEAQWAQDLPNWIAGHVRAHDDLGGVPPVTVPDNLKAGVTHPCRYEPELNKTYHDFAVHCGTAVVPARVVKPRDKAKVETAVQVVERHVLAPLRHMDFIGLAALNDAIAERLALVNRRVMRHIGQSRLELLESVDRPALLPLPEGPFEVADWKLVKVGIDYHVEFDHHFYSVPYHLIGERLDVRATAGTIEVFLRGARVASHPRSYRRGGHTTDPAHMPESHRAYAKWTPERFRRWAQRIGPHTTAAVERLLSGRVHPQQAFRSCLGVLRLGDRYTPERLEAACHRAVTFDTVGYKAIKHILCAGLDAAPTEVPVEAPTTAHANVRGPGYYR
jgi:transposase